MLAFMAFMASGIMNAPSFAHAARAPMQVAEVVQTDLGNSSAGGDTTSTTVVASEGPVPQQQPGAGARSPSIGPIIVPTTGSSFTGAWWLIAFGGLQLVGLFFITRRARARLSTDDAQP